MRAIIMDESAVVFERGTSNGRHSRGAAKHLVARSSTIDGELLALTSSCWRPKHGRGNPNCWPLPIVQKGLPPWIVEDSGETQQQ